MTSNPLTIGNLRLATNLLLAPMAGYTDLAFRLVARRLGGVGLACTDLLCPRGLLEENRGSMELAATCPDDSPLCMQLYGTDPDLLADATRWCEDHGAAVVDINMGCPVEKITAKTGGSALLLDLARATTIAQSMVKAVRRIPVTAKLRLGWDDAHIVAPQLAARLEDVGIAAVAIHGRTTAMHYAGQCRLDGIAAVVAAVKHIPVIGNGDVRSPADAVRMLERTGCAGVMMGREAISAPWIFRDTAAVLAGDPPPPRMMAGEICAIMREHFANLMRLRDERTAVLEFRQRIRWYAKHLNPCRDLREGMRFIKSAGEFEEVLDAFLAVRSSRRATNAAL